MEQSCTSYSPDSSIDSCRLQWCVDTRLSLRVIVFPVMLLMVILNAPVSVAQTLMSVASEEVGYGEMVALDVSIQNQAPFSGFQLDLILPGPFSYKVDSAVLSARAVDHTVSADMISDDRLRIIVYSMNLSAFDGDSGPVISLTYETGVSAGASTQNGLEGGPGVYPVSIENASVVSMDQTDMLDQVSGGEVTLIAPRMLVQPETIDFGEIPLNEESGQTYQLQNTGNAKLQISGISVDDERFAIVSDPPEELQPGTTAQIEVSFSALEPGDYKGTITMASNDPIDPAAEVALMAHAFSVNELYLDEKQVRSSMEEHFRIRIQNMDPFTAFQFTVPLPENVHYIENSGELSGRETDHVISADTTAGKLKVIAYSPSNASFTGSEGTVAGISLVAEGTMGSYNLPLQDVIISSPEGHNILSDSYDGHIEIRSPRLNLSNHEIAYGPTVVTDVATRTLAINNHGNDTLIVHALSFDHEAFYSDTGLPFYVQPWEQRQIEIHFHNSQPEAITGTMLVRSNDAANDPGEVRLTGESIHRNVLKLSGTRGYVDETSDLFLELENMDPVSALQFDLLLPEHFTLLTDEISLTDRTSGFTFAVNQTGEWTWRVIAYSPGLEAISGDEGPILHLPVETSTESGDYDIMLADPVLSDPDANNLNVETEASVFQNRSREIRVERTLRTDWNLVSLPVESSDPHVDTIFPDADSHMFGYDDRYVISEYLEPGKGYWAAFESSLKKAFEGEPVLMDTLQLNSGWNLIGSISDTVRLSAMETSEADLFDSFLFGFDQGYYFSDFVIPGHGYWIKAAKEGYIVFKSDKSEWDFQKQRMKVPDGGDIEVQPADMDLDTLNSITFQDNGDHSMTLYFTPFHIPPEDLAVYELPPPPPADAFDVRFSSQRMVASLSDGSDWFSKDLELRTPNFPVTVTPRIRNEDVAFVLISGTENASGHSHVLTNDVPFELEQSSSEALRLQVKSETDTTTTNALKDDFPVAFSLGQNYPNPFNSTTVIPFHLPTASNVTIEVFDIHGQRVEWIKEQNFAAGHHEVRFNAEQLSTGLYVVRLQADRWTATRKILYIK